jgi:hypothetical protein
MARKREREMRDDPVSPDFFRWHVYEAGYRFERRRCVDVYLGIPFDDQMLVPATEDGRIREYDPLAIAELFRAFAQTDTKKEPIIAFANQYGHLGVDMPRWFKTGDDPRLSAPAVNESASVWLAEILALRLALDIWETAAAGDVAAVRRLLTRYYHPTPPARRKVEARRRAVDRAVDGCAESIVVDQIMIHCEPVRAARAVAVCEANARLKEHCSPVLRHRSRQPDSYVLRLVPRDLLGCLWWQFARFVTGQSSYRECGTCGRPMEIATAAGEHGFRSDREFCSDKCKVKDFRRRGRARELKAEGKSVRQIALEMAATPEKVKGWLARKK